MTSAVERAAIVALLSLPRLGPSRYAALVDGHGPAAAWERLRTRRVDDLPDVDLRLHGDGRRGLLTSWRETASGIDPAERLAHHRAAGVVVLVPGDPSWPDCFEDDPEPPAALFLRGDPGVVHPRSVAVVGRARASAVGIRVARGIGEGLARSGVVVVSGLALGIDGAAHLGALDAGGRPLGIVGTGLDVVYPRRHGELWERVAAEGALVSEWPMGTKPDRWRFPARNRLVAAMSAIVVVVESGARGGSLHTVEAALARDRRVMAVPGPVLAAHAQGTNQLLHDGCDVARDATDVLIALGLDGARVAPAAGAMTGPETAPATPPLSPEQRAVLRALSTEPASIDEVVDRLDISPTRVATALAVLESAILVHRVPGGYCLAVR